MNTKYRIQVIGLVLGVLAIGLVVWLFSRGETVSDIDVAVTQVAPEGEAIDTALDFYGEWLSALQSTTTDPYQLGLDKSSLLSKDLSEKLSNGKGQDVELDPVLCLKDVPNKIGGKILFEQEFKAQVIIIPRGSDVPEQAVVTLEVEGNLWKITDITCTAGDVPPVREFSFEKEGLLLKSVVPPLDPQYWHLVYEEDGVFGHATPLYFDDGSMCEETSGAEGTCDSSKFMETAKALVQGEMTETGVTVKKVRLLE